MTASAAGLASPWLVLLLATWLLTVVAVAAVMYLIAKAAIDKTDPRDLPAVLSALAPVLHSTARLVKRTPEPPTVGGITPLPPGPDGAGQHGIGEHREGGPTW